METLQFASAALDHHYKNKGDREFELVNEGQCHSRDVSNPPSTSRERVVKFFGDR